MDVASSYGEEGVIIEGVLSLEHPLYFFKADFIKWLFFHNKYRYIFLLEYSQ